MCLDDACVLVALFRNRHGHVGAQLLHTAVMPRARRQVLRHLAHMAGTFVHALQERIQPVAEGVVTLWAAHAPDLLQLLRRKAAGRARWIAIGRMAVAAGANEGLGEAEAHVVGHAFALGALFAQIHRRHLTIDDLGQKYGGFRLANITLHGLGNFNSVGYINQYVAAILPDTRGLGQTLSLVNPPRSVRV